MNLQITNNKKKGRQLRQAEDTLEGRFRGKLLLLIQRFLNLLTFILGAIILLIFQSFEKTLILIDFC